MFDKFGVITVSSDSIGDPTDLAIDVDALDVVQVDQNYEFFTDPSMLTKVAEALKDKGHELVRSILGLY